MTSSNLCLRNLINLPFQISPVLISLNFYIQRNQSIKYASWLLDEIEKRIKIISMYPKIGRETDLEFIRLLPFNHYGIIYKENVEIIYIESIWDFRQNPMKRLDKIWIPNFILNIYFWSAKNCLAIKNIFSLLKFYYCTFDSYVGRLHCNRHPMERYPLFQFWLDPL